MNPLINNRFELIKLNQFNQYRHPIQISAQEHEHLFAMLLKEDLSWLSDDSITQNAVKMQILSIIDKMHKRLSKPKAHTTSKEQITLKLNHSETWAIAYVLDNFLFDSTDVYGNCLSRKIIDQVHRNTLQISASNTRQTLIS